MSPHARRQEPAGARPQEPAGSRRRRTGRRVAVFVLVVLAALLLGRIGSGTEDGPAAPPSPGSPARSSALPG